VHGNRMRRPIAAVVCAIVSLGLSGCFKRVRVVVLPVNQAPIALVDASVDDLPMVDAPETEELPVPIAAAAARPRIRRRVVAKTPSTAAVNAPTEVALTDPGTEESAIGALTTGEDTSPQRLKEIADLIASNDRRLKALTAKTVNSQHSQISKIRNFQRQAQRALDSGDAEGAKTLATKASLLLNDLDRGGGH